MKHEFNQTKKNEKKYQSDDNHFAIFFVYKG